MMMKYYNDDEEDDNDDEILQKAFSLNITIMEYKKAMKNHTKTKITPEQNEKNEKKAFDLFKQAVGKGNDKAMKFFGNILRKWMRCN